MTDLFHQILIYLYENNGLHREIDITDFLKTQLGTDYNHPSILPTAKKTLQLLSDNPNKYTNRFNVPHLGQTTNNVYHNLDNSYVRVVLELPGYTYISEIAAEQKKRQLLEAQADSIIETNKSVKETNKSIQNLYDKVIPNNFTSQNKTTYISIGVAIVSLIFIGLSTYFQAIDKTGTEVQTLTEKLKETQQKLQDIQSSLKEINSSIQTKKIDTIYVKTK